MTEKGCAMTLGDSDVPLGLPSGGPLWTTVGTGVGDKRIVTTL